MSNINTLEFAVRKHGFHMYKHENFDETGEIWITKGDIEINRWNVRANPNDEPKFEISITWGSMSKNLEDMHDYIEDLQKAQFIGYVLEGLEN